MKEIKSAEVILKKWDDTLHPDDPNSDELWSAMINEDVAIQATLQAMHEYAAQFQTDGDGWVKVATELPQSGEYVFALHRGLNGKLYPLVAVYTTGWDLDVDWEDDNDHLNVKDENAYMPIGWYESCEQSNGSYDYIFVKRNVEYWKKVVLPLPSKPKE